MLKMEKIQNVAICALINDGKILLIKRKKPPYHKHFGLIGGKLEFGEHVEEAAVREFYEETGIKAEFKELRGIASEVVHDKESDTKKMHFLLFVCAISADTTDVVESEEGELKWFDIDNLKKEELIASDYLMIKEFILKDNHVKIHKVKMIEDGDEYYVEEFL